MYELIPPFRTALNTPFAHAMATCLSNAALLG